jgi:eukaryotic-like serine/threonine-protein kinase
MNGPLPSRLPPILNDTYQVQREIAHGGMATVYLAKDLRHGREVAIKVLHAELTAVMGPERFRREIEIASRLTHPHILPVYDSGRVGDSLYYVAPYIEGQSLRQRLIGERQLGIEETVRIATEVASALDYAHRHAVVHRDIKPENILIEDGHAVVADFGIATALEGADREQLTQSGMVPGTPAYMSPEQSSGEKTLDGRSDQYALACVVYEMLIGQPPFVGATVQQTVVKHLTQPVPSLLALRSSIPTHLNSAVIRALEKVPADRFSTLSDFARALNGTTEIPQRPASLGRRRAWYARTKMGALLASVVLLISLLAFVIARRSSFDARGSSKPVASRRVAVLYFRDLSPDSSLRALADGLTETLIRRLADVRGLDVVSENAVQTFRGRAVSADSIGRALRVGYLVDGGLGRGGDRYELTLRLIDASNGAVLEHTTFGARVSNLAALRDSLATNAVDFLGPRVGEQITLRAVRTGTMNNEAWVLFYRGEQLLKERGQSNDSVLVEADSLFARAERLDNQWTGPPVARGRTALLGIKPGTSIETFDQLIRKGLDHIDRALAINPRDPDALVVRGELLLNRWHRHPEIRIGADSTVLRQAEDALTLVTENDPDNARAWNLLSFAYNDRQDFARSALAAERAYRADEFLKEGPVILWRAFAAYYDLQSWVEAERLCAEGRSRLPTEPRFIRCRLMLMASPGFRQPDPEHAWPMVAGIVSLSSPTRREYARREAEIFTAGVLARAGLTDSARRTLKRARAGIDVDPDRDLVGLEAVIRETTLGDREEALRLLAQYLVANPSHKSGMARSPTWWWRNMRTDPRFRELLGMK